MKKSTSEHCFKSLQLQIAIRLKLKSEYDYKILDFDGDFLFPLFHAIDTQEYASAVVNLKLWRQLFLQHRFYILLFF